MPTETQCREAIDRVAQRHVEQSQGRMRHEDARNLVVKAVKRGDQRHGR